MTEGHEDYLGDLWDLLPTNPTDFIEDTPTEDESEKTPSSEWAFDHKADVSAHHTKFTITEHDLAARHSLAVLDPLVCSEAEAAGLISDHKDLPAAHHAKFTAAEARDAINDIFGADGKADSDIDIDTHALENVTNLASRTTAAWSKTIGPTGDYATFATAVAAMPDLFRHHVTVTLQQGVTLTESCSIRNKHAIWPGITLYIRAARYYPTSGGLPTADGAGATYLEDISVFTVDDYYNNCWILVCDGTGTDNGFVKITDTDQATGRAIVASWPGTEPDNTSKYVIVGALIDGEGVRNYPLFLGNCTVRIEMFGVGINDAGYIGLRLDVCSAIDVRYSGIFGSDRAGVRPAAIQMFNIFYSGIVGNNTDNNANGGGVWSSYPSYTYLVGNGISDNNQQGVLIAEGVYASLIGNFGDNNGDWGTYAKDGGIANCSGTECSGASGDHSNGVGDGSLAY